VAGTFCWRLLWHRSTEEGSKDVVLGQALVAAGSCRLRRPPDACEPTLGPGKRPGHCISLESKERNFLSLSGPYG